MKNLWNICHESRSSPKKRPWISTPFIQAGATEQLDTWTWYESEIIGITSSNYQITVLEKLSFLVGFFLVYILYIYTYTHTLQMYPCQYTFWISTLLIPFSAPTDTPATRTSTCEARVLTPAASSNRFDEELEIPQWFQIHHPQELDPRSLNGPKRWPS